MIARDVKFHESPNTRKDISKQEPSLLNITKDDDQDFIEIDFTKSNVSVEKHRHEAEEIDNMQDIWSECQEYPAECDEDVSSSRRLKVEQQAEETRRDTLDQLKMTTRAPGRPRILRTGSVGRPKKIYQTREVERSVTSTDANEVEDFAGSTEITLKNALKKERRNLSPSVLAAGCSGLQKSNREVSPVLSIASTVSELDFSYNQNNSKLTVADVYSYSSSEEENESQNFLYKGHITPKKQTINNPLRDTNETNSVGFICSNENEDNLPLSTFKKRKNKTPFQKFLATPNYAVEKTKHQRKKAINYKGQRITKDLFTQGIDKKTKKVKDLSMIQPIKKQKKDLRDNYTPRDKEINTKKINKKWNKLNEKEEKMDNNKENDDLEAWYCHACCESEMLDMRQCTNCRKWYHEDCVGLTKADKEFICSDCQINTNS
ncbi:hypothetical protein K1T71_002436 [Dendrolimus kikuchii]|uniref:Uncharacterized protein n=1 Tax=Dendrolimus kikuchii TaxID=765133 RepID=A0ACC1DCL8_9NEOP|nr:hypothetical protein K1T71_002436 [Dendrolimus kikuchii]